MRMASEPGTGEGDDLELLAAVDGIDSVAGEKALPRFHFDEDEQAAAADDEVHLAVAQPYVPRDDAITAQTIEPCRATLAAYAQFS